jgi:acetylornithine deacetylase
MMVAAERLRDAGVRVGLLLLVGEETNHDGAKAANVWIVKNRPKARRALINGEPTENRLGVGTKGTLRVTIRVAGVAAHSAYPEMGRSATHDLVRLLSELDAQVWPSDPVLGETTVNIGSLSGGTADNVFAPKASARLMFRLVSDPAVVKEHVINWVGDRAAMEWGVAVPPLHLGTIDGFVSDVVAYATDIPMLTNWGVPYLYGPGSIHVAHTDGELVHVADLDRAIDDYVRLGQRALHAL